MPPPKPDDQDAARLVAQRQTRQGDPRVGQFQVIGIAQLDHALPRPAFLKSQGPQAVFLRDDDRAVRRGLFVQQDLIRMDQHDQSDHSDDSSIQKRTTIHGDKLQEDFMCHILAADRAADKARGGR